MCKSTPDSYSDGRNTSCSSNPTCCVGADSFSDNERMTNGSDPSAHGQDCGETRHDSYQSWRQTFATFFLASAVFVAGFRYGEVHGERNGTGATTGINLREPTNLPITPNTEIGSRTEPSYGKFLLVSSQRSGSRFMTSLLDDHSKITCGAEELLKLDIEDLPLEDYVEQIEHAWSRLLRESKSSAHESPKFDGFKIMYNQGPLHYGEDLIMELDRMGVKVIHLNRRNKLLQYISNMSNRKDNKHNDKHNAHPETEEEASRLREITVNGDPDHVLKYMEWREREATEVSELLSTHLESSNYLEIIYEDLSENTDAEMSRVFEFIGAGAESVSSTFKKIHKDKRIRDYFKKDDQKELKKALKKSEFSWVLDGW